MEQSHKNYYDILEVPIAASQEDIKGGYTRAKNAYSQDSLALYSLMTEEECNEILNLIEEAYIVLSDPSKRKEYDNVRGFNKGQEGIYLEGHEPSQIQTGNTSTNIQVTAQEEKEKVEKKNLTSIVAQNKYQLSYKKNDQLEQEIEQCTHFTGDFLKQIREYKCVDVPRMSEMTKVSKTYINNIEAENLTNLPALVYVRGFVYQYAKCLKLNPDLVANSYISHMKKIESGEE